ncbi:MAG: aspartate-semialdehyde dehydrogenase [Spirochaetales bacterium]|nr:aspartate-semialdehyde dehydrogenase [Spirochaetales bacterium]
MNEKIKVGIIGATGMVGQNYLLFLEKHPWFEVSFLAASERSAGKNYEQVAGPKWRMGKPVPERFRKMKVHSALDPVAAAKMCSFVFSAFSADKDTTRKIENEYADAGLPVVSNNSAHRLTANVPIVMPEVNYGIIEMLGEQQKQEGRDRGFIVTKPNCGIQSYMIPIAALRQAGLDIRNIITCNLQALSGAGYPGQSALDVIDNIIALPSEEEKAFVEPQKIFGCFADGIIKSDESLKISSNCIRVPVVHGHSACVWFGVENGKPSITDVEEIFRKYRSEPQRLGLPSAPDPVIRYFADDEHPQPRNDRDAGSGMAVTVGRLQQSPVLGYRFTTLSHNTIRGAAGGAILTAELLTAKGWIK